MLLQLWYLYYCCLDFLNNFHLSTYNFVQILYYNMLTLQKVHSYCRADLCNYFRTARLYHHQELPLSDYHHTLSELLRLLPLYLRKFHLYTYNFVQILNYLLYYYYLADYKYSTHSAIPRHYCGLLHYNLLHTLHPWRLL